LAKSAATGEAVDLVTDSPTSRFYASIVGHSFFQCGAVKIAAGIGRIVIIRVRAFQLWGEA